MPLPPDPAHPHALEIHDVDTLTEVLDGGRSLSGLRIQDVDLSGHEERLLTRRDVEGLVVLGGRISPTLGAHLRRQGALIFPTDPDAPVNPYRATLYDPHELYSGLREAGYECTPDARAYEWSVDGALRHDAFVTLLRAIHDDSVSDALTEFLHERPVVGVMGGHAMQRGTPEYAAAARLGHALAGADLTVATGGGPGAMEAANLGAFCARDDALEDALVKLGDVPSFRPSIEDWAGLALDVHDGLPASSARGSSVGIPTWFYGHEPPNVFCHGIAKYFSNAIREDGLLARCTAGLVVLEGAAGTVQEIFQAAARLYYAPETTPLPGMVLVGREHWSERLPVWPALSALGLGRAMGDAVHLVDSIEEAVDLLTPA